MRSFGFLLALAGIGLGPSIGCSLLNAPDETMATPIPGASGGGGGAPSSSSSSSSSGAGSGGEIAGGAGGSGAAGSALCGNGALEADEECDDGNDDAGDACSSDCKITEFDIENDASVASELPDVGTSGVDGHRGFFVAWRYQAPLGAEIRGRAYKANGERAYTTPLLLSTSVAPGTVRVATNSDGRSLVAWDLTTTSAIRYRTVDPDGTVSTGSDEGVPGASALGGIGVAVNESGHFAVLWLEPTAGGRNLVARCFNPDGAPVPEGSNEIVGNTSGGNFPGLWGIKTGFVAAWVGKWQEQSAIVARKLDTACAGEGDAFALSVGPQANFPAGAHVGPNDEFLAVFNQSIDVGTGAKSRIVRRSFSAPANSPDVEQLVSSSDLTETMGRVVRHTNGRFIVVWTENPIGDCRIKARLFGSNSLPLGPEFVVNQYDNGCQSRPGAAVNADGDAMIVWNNDDHGPPRISGVIYPRLLVK